MAPPTTASKHQNDTTGASPAHDAASVVAGPIDNKDKPRWGKWTKEEEAYTARLIADFTAGLLNDVDNGTTMRSWLSAKLRCCPMRISKKFVGEHSIGKRMFERNDSKIAEMTDADKTLRATELDALHADFCESWAREERERLEHQTNGTRKRKRNKQPKKPKPSVAPATTGMATKRPVSPLAFKHPPRAIAAPIQTLSKSMAMPHHHTQPHKRQPSAMVAMPAKTKLVHRAAQAPVKAAPSMPRSMVQPSTLSVPRAASAAATCTLIDLQQSLATRSRNLSVDLTAGDLFAKTSSNGGELDFTEFAMDVTCRDDATHPFDLMDTTDGAAWMTEPLDHEVDEDPFVSFDAAASLMLPPQVQVQFADLGQVKAGECGEMVDLALSPTSVMDMDGDAAWSSLAIDYDAFFAHQY